MASAPVLDVTPKQALNELQSGFGLTDEDLIGALGISARTLQRWRTGSAYPQQAARHRLSELLRLLERAGKTYEGDDSARAWAHSESRYLGGMKPVEAIRAGRFDRAEATLEAFDSGIFL
jgi:uncharacterized protein (DUF2384 family)